MAEPTPGQETCSCGAVIPVEDLDRLEAHGLLAGQRGSRRRDGRFTAYKCKLASGRNEIVVDDAGESRLG